MKKLSIIIPYFHKLSEFKRVLPWNYKYFNNPDYEVIIVKDEPDQNAELLELCNQCKPIDFKIFVKRDDHPWRVPSCALNVGIRNSIGEHCLVVSPESLMARDVPRILLSTAENNPFSFCTGVVTFKTFDEFNQNDVDWTTTRQQPYGSICAKTQHLKDIRGYREDNPTWGGDDDNIRIRLMNNQITRIQVPGARLIHLQDQVRPKKTKSKEDIEKYVKTKEVLANDENWGTDFSERIL